MAVVVEHTGHVVVVVAQRLVQSVVDEPAAVVDSTFVVVVPDTVAELLQQPRNLDKVVDTPSWLEVVVMFVRMLLLDNPPALIQPSLALPPAAADSDFGVLRTAVVVVVVVHIVPLPETTAVAVDAVAGERLLLVQKQQLVVVVVARREVSHLVPLNDP